LIFVFGGNGDSFDFGLYFINLPPKIIMVLTRAARKRGSEDSEKEESLHAAASRPECIDLTDSDGEDEALSQPKTKRQRKSLRSTSAATTTRETNKGQALQQLDHNVHNKRRSRHNTVPEQSMEPSSARVVSENSTTKRAQVTKTHQNVSTRNKFSSQSTFSISLRKNKVVPIKTPATEPSVSGNNATSRLDTTTTNAHRFITRNRASKSKGTAEDIDAREQNDPQNVTDYVRDIYDHYRTQEVVYFIDQPMCRIRHPHITERMRTILVDWILEVHYKFKLNPHTLYLTVSILDRYLHKTQVPVTRRDLQLVGITSLLLAAKYEEMFVPELRDLAYICDGAYTESQVCRVCCMSLFMDSLFHLHYKFTFSSQTDSRHGGTHFEGYRIQFDRTIRAFLSRSISQGGKCQQDCRRPLLHDSGQHIIDIFGSDMSLPAQSTCCSGHFGGQKVLRMAGLVTYTATVLGVH
jgi:hypothetical protein